MKYLKPSLLKETLLDTNIVLISISYFWLNLCFLISVLQKHNFSYPFLYKVKKNYIYVSIFWTS